MTEPQVQIVGVSLLDDGGLEIAYIELTKDLKKNGLAWTHTVRVPRGSDYDEELESFYEALGEVLRDALDDRDRAESIEFIDPLEQTEDDE